jgi:bla regulator protein blaR1
MQTLESNLLSYLLNSVWQLPLLWAAGSIAALLLRPGGPRAEHRAWVVTLWMQCLLPACSLVPWAYVRAFSIRIGKRGQIGHPHVSVQWADGTAVGALPWASGIWHALAILYAAGCTYLIGRFLWRLWSVHTLRRNAVAMVLQEETAHAWRQACENFRVHGATVVTSSRIAGPVTMGLRRKLLLLPTTLAQTLGLADLRSIIAHECAHMSRNDFLKNLLYELLALPVAYHPFLWPVRERIVQTREMVCDEMAAGLTGHHAYAQSLLRLASIVVGGTPLRTPHSIGIFDAHPFERRLMNLVNQHKEVKGLRRLGRLIACAALAVSTCGIALALGMHVEATQSASQGTSRLPASLTVPARVMSGNLLTKAAPVYPPAAKKAKIEGTVVLSAVISKDGKVESLRVLSGPNELQQSSLDAVRQWTYKPYLLNGDPVEVKTTVHIIYSLAG